MAADMTGVNLPLGHFKETQCNQRANTSHLELNPYTPRARWCFSEKPSLGFLPDQDTLPLPNQAWPTPALSCTSVSSNSKPVIYSPPKLLMTTLIVFLSSVSCVAAVQVLDSRTSVHLDPVYWSSDLHSPSASPLRYLFLLCLSHPPTHSSINPYTPADYTDIHTPL